MSRLALVCLAFAFAAPLSAQTHLADSSGIYLGVAGGYSSSGLSTTGIAAGYRQANGLDYGLSYTLGRGNGTATSYTGATLGLMVGQTLDVGAGANVRVEGAGFQRSLTAFTGSTSEDQFSSNVLGADVSAAISRPIRLIRSVRITPSAGLYATLARATSEKSTGRYDGLSISGQDVGTELGATLSFRLFGTDISMPFQTRLSFEGGRFGSLAPVLRPSSSIRINF